ncbi:hypothetical protein E5163_11690 [Marinicauda algicola]|uniref:T3SS negative regulator,GrlR n=1 Tax=Marinicauda algicola TaxID=2029849 RepID=A0A4S2GZV9_9PROT|nr:GrlR family regulatory protein [Marinicauda algicola]TGY88471.1 hypothetical protein E5163_11690 [Marinicauda algicola]
MKDGLYIAHFRTPLDEGAGVIVISAGRVLGGDSGMYYSGHVSGEDDRIAVEMTVRKHNETAQSVFGDFETFKLTLTGRERAGIYEFQGRADAAPSMKFTATLEPAEL